MSRTRVIPLLASPQGGVAASSRKFRAATEADAAGVVFLLFSSENHPGLAISGGFAMIFWIARPPLLAVMQGGESPYSDLFTDPQRDGHEKWNQQRRREKGNAAREEC